MRPGFYRFARNLLRVVYGVIHPIRIHNPENIPAEGPTIVCGNHISMNDPLVVGCCLNAPLQFMAKKELFEIKPLKPILDALGAFPVDRGASDTSALRTAINVLKEERILGIFPEGTRHTDEEVHPIESGVALIALRARATLVPVYIEGPYRRFRPVHVTFGPPISFAGHEGRIDRAAIDDATRKIEQCIWALKSVK